VFVATVTTMSSLREVVLTQKAELEGQLRRPYVERLLPPQAVAETDLIRVIVGPRRAGAHVTGSLTRHKKEGGSPSGLTQDHVWAILGP